jgi:P27 family predicted phage terminase small subunit
MQTMGTLSADSGATIEIHVRNLVRMRAAEAHVAEHGVMVSAPRTGLPMQNPHLKISERAAGLVLKTAAELGFSPTAHSRVRSDDDAPVYAELSREELVAEKERLESQLEKTAQGNRRAFVQ